MVLKKVLPIKNEKPLMNKESCSNHCCSKWLRCTIFTVVTLFILLSVAKFCLVTYSVKKLVDTSTYQIVFLNNNESYFGKLEKVSREYYKLNDVYYLKYFPKLQDQAAATDTSTESPTANSTNTDTSTDTSNYELKLIRLGDNEFYKPQNTMVIPEGNIIHWENVQKDSDVMKYIEGNNK